MDTRLKLFVLGLALSLAAAFSSSAAAITTYAGTGTADYTGDGGPATNATLSPWGIAVDPAGDPYVVDINRPVVRRVDHATSHIPMVVGKDSEAIKTLTETATAASTHL